MEFITLWTFSQSWALKNLLNLYWADADAAAKHSVMEVFSALSSSVIFAVENVLRISMRLKGSSDRDLIRCYPVPTQWGRGLKELAEENIIYKSETSGRSYSFNTAEKLNILLLRMIRRTGLIKVGSYVDLDFDHQFIPAHKFDAKYSYKQDHGCFPGWASIGGIIVGGENRDGNTNVKFHQEDSMSL